MRLNHITIRTNDLLGTKSFLVKVFELKEAACSKDISDLSEFWLFDKDVPLVHVIKSIGDNTDYVAETIDHVSFELDDFLKFREKLEFLKINYSVEERKGMHEKQVYFRMPTGILLEVVFN
ncbi:MAG: hypothetical protein ABI441_01750 [Flavobacterium sp.]